MPAEAATAWVESPLQLLCAVEYAFESGRQLRIIPRAGAAQLPATAARLAELGLPTGTRIESPRGLPALGGAHWVIGDGFSGMARSAIALRMPQRLTIVDDGFASRSLPAVLRGTDPLGRGTDTAAQRAIAELAGSRLRALALAERLELFSYYPLDHPAHSANRFAWLRTRGVGSEVRGRVVLGSASVVDGLRTEREYLEWLGGLDGPLQYFPHRRETPSLLALVAELPGVTVARTGLPIELVLAGAPDLEVLTLPSSAVESLRIILDGTGSRVVVKELVLR